MIATKPFMDSELIKDAQPLGRFLLEESFEPAGMIGPNDVVLRSAKPCR
jgi:hypothetical protein